MSAYAPFVHWQLRRAIVAVTHAAMRGIVVDVELLRADLGLDVEEVMELLLEASYAAQAPLNLPLDRSILN